jgi:hypothetical protein
MLINLKILVFKTTKYRYVQTQYNPIRTSDGCAISQHAVQLYITKRTRDIWVLDMTSICFSPIEVSRSNSANFSYVWSVPERKNIFYNVIVLMPSMGFEPWSLWHAHSNWLYVVDVHHYTKSSGPNKPSDIVLISGQTIQNTRQVLDVNHYERETNICHIQVFFGHNVPPLVYLRIR